jgi:hypothetical protein
MSSSLEKFSAVLNDFGRIDVPVAVRFWGHKRYSERGDVAALLRF